MWCSDRKSKMFGGVIGCWNIHAGKHSHYLSAFALKYVIFMKPSPQLEKMLDVIDAF